MTTNDIDRLSDYFVSRSSIFHGRDTRVNRNVMSWAFSSMLRDMSENKIRSLIDFYFDNYAHNSHDFNGFQYSYEQIEEAMIYREQEVSHIENLRRESAERAKEWRLQRERITGHRSDSKREE